MKQIRVERPSSAVIEPALQFLPLDPRDPDIVRAKALSRAARKPTAKPST